MTWSSSAAKPNAAKPASCASKARSASCRTATSATSGSMSKALAFVLAMSAVAFARPKPKHTRPHAPQVVYAGVRYVASQRLVANGSETSAQAYVEAWDTKNKNKLWEARLDEPKSETADERKPVIVTSMKIVGDMLVVSAKFGGTYEINLESHAVARR